jgi:hypothetical protein
MTCSEVTPLCPTSADDNTLITQEDCEFRWRLLHNIGVLAAALYHAGQSNRDRGVNADRTGGASCCGAAKRSSARSRSILLRATPVALETAVTPPRPAARASLATNSLRARSFSRGDSASKRAFMATMSITRAG